MRRKKRSLTLLEVMIALFLLSALLSGLFFTFRHGAQRGSVAKELKQKVLQLELFQHKMKHLLAQEEGVWIERHPDVAAPALFILFTQKADPDADLCTELQGMLYLNAKKELCFVVWSPQGKGRVETLLSEVDSFSCSLFDPKKGEWHSQWPQKKEGAPSMANLQLKWNGTDIPFVFFLKSSRDKITYKGQL
jgi:type II secretory pathway pseudopilin PulG